LWFLFSKGIEHCFLSSRNKSIAVLVLLAATFLFAPILAGILFRVGVIIEEGSGRWEEGSGILWGCSVEYALLACMCLAALLFFTLTIGCIIALISPHGFNFQKRINILPVFILQNIFAVLLPVLMGKVILNMLQFAHGIDASCL
jgi:hypothetical protein